MSNKYNVIYDDRVVKVSLNIPIPIHDKLVDYCLSRRPAPTKSSVLIEALIRFFNTSYTAKQLIDYEIMRRLGEINLGELPARIDNSETEKKERQYDFHGYPGFYADLESDPFRLNKFRREKENRRYNYFAK